MSTNYFLKKGGCGLNGCCEQSWHIGLRARGWRFHFHGNNPMGGCIESAAKWLEVLEMLLAIRDSNGHAVWRLVDEYDDETSLAEFWAMVEGTRGGRRQEYYGKYVDCDADGWCIDSREFC